MKTEVKVLFGGILGMITMSLISSTYFYHFFKKVSKKLNQSLKDYNY